MKIEVDFSKIVKNDNVQDISFIKTVFKVAYNRAPEDFSIEEALQDVIYFDDKTYPNDAIFWVSNNGKIVDGNGNVVSKNEADKKRALVK